MDDKALLDAMQAMLKEELKPIKADITGIKEDIEAIKEDVAALKHNVGKIGDWAERMESTHNVGLYE